VSNHEPRRRGTAPATERFSLYNDLMYRVQFFCPRQSPYWQDLSGFFGPEVYPHWDGAVAACNRLLWQYHSARVLDQNGEELYRV
jgi:hypothetical protein